MLPRRTTSLAIAVTGVFAVSFMAWGNLGGTRGVEIPYSGILTKGNGVAPDVVDLEFVIMNDATTPVSVVDQCDRVTVLRATVTEGRFAALLTGIDEACVKDREVFLDIAVREATLGLFTRLGRQRVTPALAAYTSGIGDFNGVQIGALGYATFRGMRAGELAGTGLDTFALLQRTDGLFTVLNAAPGGEVDIKVGNSTKIAVPATGPVAVSTPMTVAGAVNSVELGGLGYADFRGLRAGEQAGTGLNTFALLQKTDGLLTVLNAAPGGEVDIKVGNSPVMAMTLGGVRVFPTLNLNGDLLVGGRIHGTSATSAAAVVIGAAPMTNPATTFAVRGGRYLITGSGTAYATANGQLIALQVFVDGTSVVATQMVATFGQSHQLLPLAAAVIALTPGNHTFRMGKHQGGEFAATTNVDSADFATVILQEVN